MTTHHKIAAILRFGAGAALLALGSAAFMGSSAEAAGPTAYCSASGPGFRQLASITVSDRDPGTCIRIKLGMAAPPGTPDCWTAVRMNGLSCINALGQPNIVDLN